MPSFAATASANGRCDVPEKTFMLLQIAFIMFLPAMCVCASLAWYSLLTLPVPVVPVVPKPSKPSRGPDRWARAQNALFASAPLGAQLLALPARQPAFDRALLGALDGERAVGDVAR